MSIVRSTTNWSSDVLSRSNVRKMLCPMPLAANAFGNASTRCASGYPHSPACTPSVAGVFLTLDHRPHLLPPSISFSMNYRCARKPRNAAEVHESSAVHRSQAVILLGWRAELCPRPLATPTMSRTAPPRQNSPSSQEITCITRWPCCARPPRRHPRCGLPIRCQQATSR